MKDLTVTRVLKDNKVPWTSAGTRAAEAPAGAQGQLQGSWERARLGCVGSQVLVWTRGGLNRKKFSKIGTQQLVRELYAAAVAAGAPPPSAPGL